MQLASHSKQNYIGYLQRLLAKHQINFQTEVEWTQLLRSDTTYNNNNNNDSNNDNSKHQVQNKQTNNQQNHQQFPYSHPIKLATNIDLLQDPLSLTHAQLSTYCRQMLLPQLSLKGQINLKHTKIGIIGCGGIGCPVGLYLAAAGIGTIGLFDNDIVDRSNLHRQIGHCVGTVGMEKVKSLKGSMLDINPLVTIVEETAINGTTQHRLGQYDLIIDGSDNPKCRLIVNQYCVRHSIPLLSGACVGWQAQLTAYGNWLTSNQITKGQNRLIESQSPLTDHPCYQCIWGPQGGIALGNCATVGIIGPVAGVAGCSVAVEAIRMIVMGQLVSAVQPQGGYKIIMAPSQLSGYLQIYTAKNAKWTKIKLRGRKNDCRVCSLTNQQVDIKTSNQQSLQQTSKQSPCEAPQCSLNVNIINNNVTPTIIEPIPSIKWHQYMNLTASSPSQNHPLLDVRPPSHYNVLHFNQTYSLPWQTLKQIQTKEQFVTYLTNHTNSLLKFTQKNILNQQQYTPKLYVMCRSGVTSKLATVKLITFGIKAVNVQGGLNQYRNVVDKQIGII